MSQPEAAPVRESLHLARFVLPLLLALSSAAGAGETYWIDVRSESEYAAGHVSPAVNIPHTEIADRIAEVTTDKDARIYLYCRSGRRSGMAQAALQAAGYTNTVNAGGFEQAQQTAVRLETCAQDPAADC